jgi:hypothetical protein
MRVQGVAHRAHKRPGLAPNPWQLQHTVYSDSKPMAWESIGGHPTQAPACLAWGPLPSHSTRSSMLFLVWGVSQGQLTFTLLPPTPLLLERCPSLGTTMDCSAQWANASAFKLLFVYNYVQASQRRRSSGGRLRRPTWRRCTPATLS